MIRINLLGVPKKTSRGRRAPAMAAAGGGEGSSTVVLALVFIGALAVLIGVAQVWVTKQHDGLEKELQRAILENQRLAEVKAKYDPDNRFRRNQNILPARAIAEPTLRRNTEQDVSIRGMSA